jgi:hypothetical protein
MVVLTAEIFFDLQSEQREAEPIIDSLIAELNLAKKSASHCELQPGSGGIVEHPQNADLLGGHWWIDATDKIFKQRFEAVEIDGNWHVLDHKHPEFISPVFSEDDAKRTVKVWNAPSTPGLF